MLVAVVIGVIVYAVTRPSAEVEFNGVELAEYDSSFGVDPAVGTKAPLFVTEDLDGRRVVTGGGAGPADTAKIFVFLDGGCDACAADLTTTAAWLETNVLPPLVEFIAVSSGFGDSAEDYTELGWTLPVLVDDGVDTAADLFGAKEGPLWVVLDNNNFVVTRTLGPISPDELQALVDVAATAFI